MVKVLIVDDNVATREGICRNIPWEENGVEIVAALRDGEEAYDYLSSHPADVVITDIVMPFWGGLELTKKIRETLGDIKIIIISAYDEFEYAQRAVSLGVFDYIMKPFDYGQLLNTVLRAVDEKRKDELLRRQVRESIPVLRERFLRQIVEGEENELVFYTDRKYLGLQFDMPFYICVLFEVDNVRAVRSRLKTEHFNMHILKIRRIIADGLKIPESMAFQLRQNCIAAVLGLAGELGEDAYLELYKSLEAIQREAERVCGMTLSVGVGPSVSPVCNLSQSYAKAKDALEYKFLMGCNKIFDSRDIRSVEEGRTFYFPTSIEEELQKHVRFGNKDGAVSCVMQLQEFFSEAGAEREYIKTTVSGIVLRLFQNLYEVGALTGESLVSQDEPIRAIQNFDDSTLLFDWLLDVIEGICEETESIMLCRHKKIVGDVERYIETNYMDEELNLNKIAKSVGVSPTYLSSIFKKGTRINISEYIQRVRMERAQDMLLFSDDLIIEISLKVGFSNQFYFSTCFKKYTGQTPNEFRNRRIRKQG